MIKKIKQKLKKLNNRGSSFVLVIVSTTFLSILVSALLMGMLLAYKLKFYKLNSLNNFYSVEKAMDEIYAGIGASTNEHLYTAYTTTAELVVTYDTTNNQYVNLDNDKANELFKKLFIQGMMSDANYENIKTCIETLKSFISDPNVSLVCNNTKIIYTDSNGNSYAEVATDGADGKLIILPSETIGPYDASKVESITFKNISVEREITLDGANSNEIMASGTYVQSITTDIVLTKPEYNVSFDMSSASSDSLYNYALLADMGIEVGDSTGASEVNVSIKGNVYAASDYYNKDYNAVTATKVTNAYATTVKNTWGATNSSAYSGIFVTGDNTVLDLASDIVICPGSLSAFNGSTINLSGRSTLVSELWTDNIIIGGTEGGTITAAANAYVYDDTELNAEESNLTFTRGNYFGYSYTGDDIRSINLLKSSGRLPSNYRLKSHFSDSAVIVNGKDSTLNLKNLSSLYIAGKSYIEFSKIAASSVSSDDDTITVGENDEIAYTTLQDYSTGQSLDVKSNQLIFLAQWEAIAGTETVDENGFTHVNIRFPSSFAADATVTSLYQEFLQDLSSADNAYMVNAIKQTVSGHDYYYLYIDDTANPGAAEAFAEKYYDMFSNYGSEITDKLYNVVDYEEFEVNLILPDEEKINAGAAVTDQDSKGTLFYHASADTVMNVDTALKAAATSKTFTLLLGNKGTTENNLTYEALKANSRKTSFNDVNLDDENAKVISNFLTYMYINMRDHLSVIDKETVDDVTNLTTSTSAWELANYTNSANGYTYSYDSVKDSYTYDYSITPLTNFVNYDYIFTNGVNVNETIDGSVIVINTDDVTLTSSTGSLDGIVICGGNVTFDSSVNSFRGLIIAGGKVICDHSMTLSSDATYVANLLEECSKSTNTNISLITREILLNYSANTSSDSASVTGASISDISYHDILLFENWKKNVE